MDSDQDLLDSHNAREEVREADEWKRNKAEHQRHENAAKEGHKVRNSARLLIVNADIRNWEELALISQKHLISDAENVSKSPSITAAELSRLYNERLIAWGDVESPDLGVGDENYPIYQVAEEMVLKRLKECLVDPLNTSTSS